MRPPMSSQTGHMPPGGTGSDQPQIAHVFCAVCRRPVSVLFGPGPRPFGWRCPYRECTRPVHNLTTFPGELIGTWTEPTRPQV